MKKIRKIIIIVLLILLFLSMTLIFTYTSLLSAVSYNQNLKEIKIASGTTSVEIGEILEENNLIKNAKFFVLYLKVNNINDLKAGTYKLSENMNLKEIIKLKEFL